MPTRRTGPGDGPLKPSVVEFLESGSTERAEREISPWVVMSLTGPLADEARRAWARGDQDGAAAALRRTVASHNLFQAGGGA